MTSIDIMARRSRIFELYAQGLTPVEIKRLVSAEYEVSERTIRNDLNEIDTWLPELVKMKATSDNRASELLAMNQLIRRKLMNIATTSKNDPSRVGALKSAMESIKNEMVFMQSLGKIDKVAEKVQAEVSGLAPVMISFHQDTELKYPEKKEEPEHE